MIEITVKQAKVILSKTIDTIKKVYILIHKLDANSSTDCYILRAEKDYYILRGEEQTPFGWIFRSVNSPAYGFNGFHATPTDVIEDALSTKYTGVIVYEFDNYMDAFEFINDQRKPSKT